MNMKIIDSEEFNKMKFNMKGKRANSLNKAVLDSLDLLEVGQALVILPSDWKTKSQPSVLIPSVYRKLRGAKKFATRTLLDDKGWVVLRKK